MSRFFKSAAFPILIVIVLAFFASKLIARSDQAPAQKFSGFLQQLDDGKVQSATLRTKDNSSEVTLMGADTGHYEVGYPLDYSDVLVNQLRTAQADGFVAALPLGFTAPSVRIPDRAFQAWLTPAYRPDLNGALVYPDVFWRRDAVGLRT